LLNITRKKKLGKRVVMCLIDTISTFLIHKGIFDNLKILKHFLPNHREKSKGYKEAIHTKENRATLKYTKSCSTSLLRREN
jgi:hypothetical protein